MKFYDKGFIKKFPTHTQVSIFSAGVAVLELKIYENQICKDTFACQDLKSFNKEFLNGSYNEDFLKTLFEKDDKIINFQDKKNNILIKITKD